MKAQRWYATQRKGRRSRRFVINVPPPTVVVTSTPMAPPPSPSSPSPPTIWTRLWALSKTLGPIFISLAAIAISLASFLNQRATNSRQIQDEKAAATAAAAASLRQWAEKVSFLQSRIGGIGPGSYVTVEIQNASISPITNVVLTVSVIALATPGSSSKSFNVSLYPSNIPPCSAGFPNVALQLQIIAEKLMHTKIRLNQIGFQVDTMYFTDRNGVNWAESVYGSLVESSLHGQYFRTFPPRGRASNLVVNYKPTSGCN